MSAIVPTERVSELLVSAGYKRLTEPLRVANIPFDFPAVFIGGAKSADLIVVADAANDKEARILQKIEGLARALDVVSSRRPLTLVLVGPRPTTKMLDTLSSVCRVLVAESAAAAEQLWRNLAVLLPLTLPALKEQIIDIEDVIATKPNDDPVTLRLKAEARDGADAVKSLLYSMLSEPFEIDDAGEGNAG